MINRYQVILLAAGKGERMCLPLNKVFYKVRNSKKCVLDYSLQLFLTDERCEKIVIVYNKDDSEYLDTILDNYQSEKICKCEGGSLRQESVLNGLEYIESDYVLVHDAARPNVSKDIIEEIIMNLGIYECCAPCVKVSDTIKKVSVKVETIDRENLYYVQTPQGAKTNILKKALENAKEKGIVVTDDLQAIELDGAYKTKLTTGDKNNIKITTKDDLLIMEYLLRCKND